MYKVKRFLSGFLHATQKDNSLLDYPLIQYLNNLTQADQVPNIDATDGITEIVLGFNKIKIIEDYNGATDETRISGTVSDDFIIME